MDISKVSEWVDTALVCSRNQCVYKICEKLKYYL